MQCLVLFESIEECLNGGFAVKQARCCDFSLARALAGGIIGGSRVR
jgi:hypothetical protein